MSSFNYPSTSGTGDVTGPSSSTDNRVPKFDGTTGKALQQSGVAIDDSNNVSGVVGLSMSGAITGATIDDDNNTVSNLVYTAFKTVVGNANKILSFDGSGVAQVIQLTNDLIASAAAIAWSKMASLTASRAMVTDGSGHASASSVTATELGYLSGVSSAIQTQIDNLTSTVNNFEWQPSALDYIADNTAAPPTETTGDRYVLSHDGGSPHANWDGASAGDIVEFNGSTWDAVTPTAGTFISVDDDATGLYLFGGSTWGFKQFEATTASNGLTKSGVDIQFTPVTANRAMASDASGLPTASATTDTELGYVSGVTSAIQTQLDAKFASADVIDEDDMSSDSATKVPTQQSVKAYVDESVGRRWQIKLASSDTTSAGTILSFTVEAGKTYRYFAQVSSTTSSSATTEVAVKDNTTVLGRVRMRFDTGVQQIGSTSGIVTMGSTTLTLDAVTAAAGAPIDGNSTRSETYMIVEELPHHSTYSGW